MSVSLFPAAGSGKQKRVDLITATGTWVAPAGVTYVIAYLVSGGGGGGGNANGANGAPSTAFGLSGVGGRGGAGTNLTVSVGSFSPAANTGIGGNNAAIGNNYVTPTAGPSPMIQGGATVVPGTSYPITIGAGGAGATGTASGGSGYVSIEYWIG
jgi:hypothetical protein